MMHGFYKFSATSAMDEDSGIAVGSAVLDAKAVAKATRVAVTEKANGKAGVVTLFRLRGQVCLFAGSKAFHLVVPLDTAAEALEAQKASGVARTICDTFLAQWEGMTPAQRAVLQAALLGGQPDLLPLPDAPPDPELTPEQRAAPHGRTLCGELLDGKHLVPLPGGADAPPTLVWFGLLNNRGCLPKEETLCADVVAFSEWCRHLGLPCVEVRVLTPSEYRRQHSTLRGGRNSEGWVLHWQTGSPDAAAPAAGTGELSDIPALPQSHGFLTVGVEKHKTLWYIIIRSLREYLKSKDSRGADREAVWRKRLKKRNTQVLKMPGGMLWLWYEITIQFIRWFTASSLEPGELFFGEESTGMGNVWASFIVDFRRRRAASAAEAEAAATGAEEGAFGEYKSWEQRLFPVTDDFKAPEEEVERRGLQAKSFEQIMHKASQVETAKRRVKEAAEAAAAAAEAAASPAPAAPDAPPPSGATLAEGAGADSGAGTGAAADPEVPPTVA